MRFGVFLPILFLALVVEFQARDDAKAVRILERPRADLAKDLKVAGKIARRAAKKHVGDTVLDNRITELHDALTAEVEAHFVAARAAHAAVPDPSAKAVRERGKAEALRAEAVAEPDRVRALKRLGKTVGRIRRWKRAVTKSTDLGAAEALSAPVATIADARITESSGLAFWGGAFWTINDSGGGPYLYRATELGFGDSARFPVPGVENVDWESLAVLDGDLLVCDIGDNNRNRADLAVHRVRWTGTAVKLLASYPVAYPDGAHDAEAALVLGGKLHVITKDRGEGTGVYRFESLAAGATNTAVRVGDLAIAAGLQVTGAAPGPDGETVLVLSYFELRVFAIADLTGPPLRTLSLPLAALQTEAVAFADDLLVITNEQGDVYAVDAFMNRE